MPPVIELHGIDKKFVGVHALKGVDIRVDAGEVRCIAGENGCGKSTLIKVISGVYPPDSGTIALNGNKYAQLSPLDSMREGIQVIYQDFSLFPNLTVAENIAFTALIDAKDRLCDWGKVRDIARRGLDRIKADIDPSAIVGELPVADKQQVAIARALLNNARLVIMDEPTTALTQREIDNLFSIVRNLTSQNISIIFVSHKLREILEICQTITIMRNGAVVADGRVDEFDEAKITRFMTGRDIGEDKFSYVPSAADAQPLLKVEHLNSGTSIRDVSFSVARGEIVGVTGLLGSGRGELALSLFGLYPLDGGEITLDGSRLKLGSVEDAVGKGIGYIPEDRLTQGLFLSKSLADNVSSTLLDTVKNWAGFLRIGELRRLAGEMLDSLQVKLSSIDSPALALSGGNQQRVVIGKWLARGPKLLILNGPTVGVDVGSKQKIHGRLRELARGGMGVIVISDDLPEIAANCNRVLLVHRGAVVREFSMDVHGEGDISEEMRKL